MLFSCMQAGAVTFIWTGGGNTSMWEDTNNWLGGAVPNNGSGSTLWTNSASDLVIFDSERGDFVAAPNEHITTPSSNPGSVKNPAIEVRNGTVSIGGGGSNWGWQGNTLTVGDGNMTTTAIVTSTWTGLSRDPNPAKNYTINADGTWNLTGNISDWAQNEKIARVFLNGGTMNVASYIAEAPLTDSPANDNDYVSFDAYGSSLTFAKGSVDGRFNDLTDVTSNIGTGLSFRLGGSLASDSNAMLDVTDGGTTWIITAISVPEPSSIGLLGLGGIALILRRRR